MATITFTAAFYGGEGSIVFDGQGIDKNTTIDSDSVPLSFNAEQTDPNQGVTVSGLIPNSATGKITVEISSGDNIISKADNNSFTPQKDDDGNLIYDFADFLLYAI